jgi:anti-sigma factor RsiW
MSDHELLIRLLGGELPADERTRVERRLAEEPELAERWSRLKDTARALEAGAADSFEPFFSTRVLARIRSVPGTESTYEGLRWAFARLAVACLVVAVGLGLYSALGGGFGGTIVEAMLGLPETTLETAWALGG